MAEVDIKAEIDRMTTELKGFREVWDKLGGEITERQNQRQALAAEMVGHQKAIDALHRIAGTAPDLDAPPPPGET